MDLEEFKKLEESIAEETFGKEYKNINTGMFCLSIFGHLSSISLAYFLVSKILSGAITDNTIVVFIATVILLGGLELLKRDIFQKFTSRVIKYQALFNKAVYPLLFLSMAVISISFYATISGAKEFSSKDKEIEKVADQTSQKYQDSLTNVYNLKIKDVEKDSKDIKDKIDEKDAQETQIGSAAKVTRQQSNRIKDLKTEKAQLRADLDKNDTTINNIKKELDSKIKDYQSKIQNTSTKKKDENKTNSFLFVCISSLIEIVILAGVYFNRYYKIRTYNDFKEKIEKDPNYQKWVLYDALLDIVYTTDYKINDKIPSLKVIMELSKLNGNIILQKDAMDFVKVLSSLNILRTSGNAKYIFKSKEIAKTIIKSHFNIK